MKRLLLIVILSIMSVIAFLIMFPVFVVVNIKVAFFEATGMILRDLWDWSELK